MKAYRGSIGTAPLILILGAAWGLDGNITPPTALLRGKTPAPIEQETGWGRSARCGNENLLSLSGFKPWTVHPVA